MNTALVLGAGGFIGNHLVARLKKEGYWVRGVDVKQPDYPIAAADEFIIADLREQALVRKCIDRSFHEIYQLAADMGGAGYINTNLYDADVMNNSATINLLVADAAYRSGSPKVFFSSSACVYNEHLQNTTVDPDCREHSAYPAMPDSEYGWEKLFSERLYLAYNRQHAMQNKVARFHNIFGEYGTWTGGKEKSPAAICRKIAMAEDGEEIEIWGDGLQTRSFLHIEDCLDGVRLLMQNELFDGPVNIGSDYMISINDFVALVAKVANKNIRIKHVPGPQGVRGRNSNNDLIREQLNWTPPRNLETRVAQTYQWIEQQVKAQK